MARYLFEKPVDDRHDKAAFFLAFFVGSVGILATRIIGDGLIEAARPLALPDFLPVAISVAVIIGYTFYIVRTPDRASISLDRAGDNAYYLGLLFTLISLAYSLYKVADIVGGSGGGQSETAFPLRASDRVIHLLPDFGLALASTIAGIFCRIFVQQFRSDPADIETQARQELGQAVRELRASLLRAVADMNTLSHATNAATTELVSRINKTLEEATAANASTITQIGSKLEELTREFGNEIGRISGFSENLVRDIRAAVAGLNDQLSRLDVDPTAVQGRLRALSDELEKLQSQIALTSAGQENIGRELAAISARMASVFSADVASSLRSAAADTLTQQGQVLSQLGELETSVSNARQKIASLAENFSKTGDELERTTESSRRALDTTVAASSEYVESLADAAEKLHRTIDDTS